MVAVAELDKLRQGDDERAAEGGEISSPGDSSARSHGAKAADAGID
jgi:hypothetical protein